MDELIARVRAAKEPSAKLIDDVRRELTQVNVERFEQYLDDQNWFAAASALVNVIFPNGGGLAGWRDVDAGWAVAMSVPCDPGPFRGTKPQYHVDHTLAILLALLVAVKEEGDD